MDNLLVAGVAAGLLLLWNRARGGPLWIGLAGVALIGAASAGMYLQIHR